MRGIAPMDVAMVDDDLMWRVDHMNAVHGPYVKDFADAKDATDALEPGHPAVIVLGPSKIGDLEAVLVELGGERSEVQVVVVIDAEDPDAPTGELDLVRARVIEAGAAAAIAGRLGDEAEVARAVLALLPAPTADALADPTAERRDAAELEVVAPPIVARLPERLVVVTSAKGGEGVTTVAANLASSLSAGGARRVALVEGDANFGDLSLLLDLPAPARQNLEQMTIDADTLAAFSVQHEPAGIRVVRPPRYEGVYVDVAAGVVLDLLAALADEADVVVVDAPLPLVVAADLLPVSSTILLVSTLRTTSLKNAMLAASALGRPKHLSLVVNEAGRHQHEPTRPDVAHATGLSVIAELPYDAKLDRAGAERSPHVLAEDRSTFRRAIDDLAATVLTTVSAAATR